ncbi:MAG: PD-(D/E)XK nuclease family protein [Candidatus Heimdallarchaeota archaeon]
MSQLNLSKTEFIAYLDCPLKFYLLKQQNLYTKQGPRSNILSKFYRIPTQRGIRAHTLLKEFYGNYGDDLQVGNPPPEQVLLDPVLRLFWDQETHRYEVEGEYWYPFALEYYLTTQTMRGIIDRIDQLDEHTCRLVEYKSSLKGSFLNEELLFYALLVSENLEFQQQYKKTVTQGAVYYYDTGEWITREITEEDILEFKDYLQTIREDIMTGNWTKRHQCKLQKHDCFFATVCTKIPDALLRESSE